MFTNCYYLMYFPFEIHCVLWLRKSWFDLVMGEVGIMEHDLENSRGYLGHQGFDCVQLIALWRPKIFCVLVQCTTWTWKPKGQVKALFI
jgi:hypothetical protein